MSAPARSYQELRSHLANLKLSRAEEVLAEHVDRARADKLSHVRFLERLLAEEVQATAAAAPRASSLRPPPGGEEASGL